MTAKDARSRVALFRARKDADASAARLRRRAFPSLACRRLRLRQPVQPRRSRYGAVVATSDKAFLADGACDTSSPLYVVGARTGRAAEARGWRLASPPAPDADELIKTLAGALKSEASVLYLAGRDRKEAIEAALAGSFALEVAEAYVAEARAAWRPAEARALAFCAAALHYSRRSAGLAAGLAKAAGVSGGSSSFTTSACRATSPNRCKRSAQAASRSPKRLTKRAFFELCGETSAGFLPSGRPVYRAREKSRARGDGRRGNPGRFGRTGGRPGNRDARRDPGVIEGEIAARKSGDNEPPPGPSAAESGAEPRAAPAARWRAGLRGFLAGAIAGLIVSALGVGAGYTLLASKADVSETANRLSALEAQARRDNSAMAADLNRDRAGAAAWTSGSARSRPARRRRGLSSTSGLGRWRRPAPGMAPPTTPPSVWRLTIRTCALTSTPSAA